MLTRIVENFPALTGRTSLVVILFICAVLPVWGKADDRARGVSLMAEERELPPCTSAYPPGAILFEDRSAVGEGAFFEELATYIKSVSGPRYWGLKNNLSLVATDDPQRPRVMELKIPKGSVNPGSRFAPRGGAGFLWTPQLPGNTRAACLAYEVRFPAGFDFVKGGKLPGIFGGEGPSGGRKVTGENGFSTRFMWRTGGKGEVYAYIVGNDGRGISLDRGAFVFKRGGWTRLVQEVILNHPGRNDGRIRVWVNGRLVISRAKLNFRTRETVHVKGVMAHVFFGGKDPSWASTRDSIVRLTPFDLRWNDKPLPEAQKPIAPVAGGKN